MRKSTTRGSGRSESTSKLAGRVQTASTRFATRLVEGVEVRFGSVTVHTSAPSKAIEERNIAEGRSALTRAKSALARSGVQVRVGSNVPLYHADPDSPGLLVRTLNGRTTRGRFVGGKFKPA